MKTNLPETRLDNSIAEVGEDGREVVVGGGWLMTGNRETATELGKRVIFCVTQLLLIKHQPKVLHPFSHRLPFLLGTPVSAFLILSKLDMSIVNTSLNLVSRPVSFGSTLAFLYQTYRGRVNFIEKYPESREHLKSQAWGEGSWRCAVYLRE